ncbi:hypothetical protein B0H17DRAFT_1139056 [Mycena rosella]|uniref:Uncharacterized protein n=1 Tax=Mycena rosella TaxID=1033263 RepID=A0AAD7G9C8_MYCRO|nr:hypothetical protein B0H17DRAFT_1139056 [Mycena rosella]
MVILGPYFTLSRPLLTQVTGGLSASCNTVGCNAAATREHVAQRSCLVGINNSETMLTTLGSLLATSILLATFWEFPTKCYQHLGVQYWFFCIPSSRSLHYPSSLALLKFLLTREFEPSALSHILSLSNGEVNRAPARTPHTRDHGESGLGWRWTVEASVKRTRVTIEGSGGLAADVGRAQSWLSPSIEEISGSGTRLLPLSAVSLVGVAIISGTRPIISGPVGLSDLSSYLVLVHPLCLTQQRTYPWLFPEEVGHPTNDPFFSGENATAWITSLGYQLYLEHDDSVIATTLWDPEDASANPLKAYRNFILSEGYLDYTFFSLDNVESWIHPVVFHAFMTLTYGSVEAHGDADQAEVPLTLHDEESRTVVDSDNGFSADMAAFEQMLFGNQSNLSINPDFNMEDFLASVEPLTLDFGATGGNSGLDTDELEYFGLPAKNTSGLVPVQQDVVDTDPSNFVPTNQPALLSLHLGGASGAQHWDWSALVPQPELPQLPPPPGPSRPSPAPEELSDLESPFAPHAIDLEFSDRNIIAGKRRRTMSTRTADAVVARPTKRKPQAGTLQSAIRKFWSNEWISRIIYYIQGMPSLRSGS